MQLSFLEDPLPMVKDAFAIDINVLGELPLVPATKHFCKEGQVWQLDKHLLIIRDLTNPENWLDYVSRDKLFLPYIGPYIALGLTHPAVIIQPNVFIAQDIVNNYISLHGDDNVCLR